MIISHSKKFIFLHCRKTAGSSISAFPSNQLGINDIQVGAFKETYNYYGMTPPLIGMMFRCNINELTKAAYKLAAYKLLRRNNKFINVYDAAVKNTYKQRFSSKPQHAYAKEVYKYFPNCWKKYFKFCVVRNPFEKVASDYFWRTRVIDKPPSFSEFIDAIEKKHTLNGLIPERFDNWPIYTINDRIAADYIIRFEDLDTELSNVIKYIGIKNDKIIKLPYTKIGRYPKQKYRDLYTSKEAFQVSKIFSNEISYFNYQF